MPKRQIVSWFYVQDSQEGGEYAQVRGDSASADFRDVYRRCLGVFFASARRAEPDASLILYLNRGWEPETQVAREFTALAASLQIELREVEYSFSPPETWTANWRNQFFVFDVLGDLAAKGSPGDLTLILDSDIVWTGSPSTPSLWDTLEKQGCLVYSLPYGPAHMVNGLNRRMLTDISDEVLGLSSRSDVIEYAGGEFIAVDYETCTVISETARGVWPAVLKRHTDGRLNFGEEAHLLSHLYRTLARKPASANQYVKRIWTQVGHYQNGERSDLGLPLWHLPAEKRYGIRRLWTDLQRSGTTGWVAREDWTVYLAKRLGVPRNGPSKSILDLSWAAKSRILRRRKK